VPAAVLVPLQERDGQLQLLFTRRSSSLRDHPGQISFPGGRQDPADGTSLRTAQRELEEELGIGAESVQILGFLAPQAVVTGFVISPVVGVIPSTASFRPDPDEVAEVFWVPLGYLANPENMRTGTRLVAGLELEVHSWTYSGHTIWGATAHIIREFLRVIGEPGR
jgi:8-oxo-dGTP pyrophosphatase MutT (NUDIX family)